MMDTLVKTLEIVNIFEKKNFTKDEAIKVADAISGKDGYVTSREFKEETKEIRKDVAEVKKEIADVKERMAGIEISNKWIMTILIAMFSGIIAIIIKLFLP